MVLVSSGTWVSIMFLFMYLSFFSSIVSSYFYAWHAFTLIMLFVDLLLWRLSWNGMDYRLCATITHHIMSELCSSCTGDILCIGICIGSNNLLSDCTNTKKTGSRNFPKNLIVEELGLIDMWCVQLYTRSYEYTSYPVWTRALVSGSPLSSLLVL